MAGWLKQNPSAMIRLEDLTKEYDATSRKQFNLVAADRLNLHVPSGEIFGSLALMAPARLPYLRWSAA